MTSDVVRGLHYQHLQSQAKPVQVIKREILDVVVDVRFDPLTYGKWGGVNLPDGSEQQLSFPQRFAYAFLTDVPKSRLPLL